MSYKINISNIDRATGRFKGRVHRALMKAVIEAKEKRGFTQSQIAELMGVDKSVVSRILNGHGNLTLKTIGDISWVLGLRPDVSFVELDAATPPHANHVTQEQVVAAEALKTSSGSKVLIVQGKQSVAPTTSRRASVSTSGSRKAEVIHAH